MATEITSVFSMWCLLLRLQRLSVNFRSRLTLWPAGAFQSRHSAALAEGRLMNCLGKDGPACPSEPSSSCQAVWLIYNHISGAFLLSSGVFPKLEVTGGAKSSRKERCIVCWDLHEIQPTVQLTNIPDPRNSHLPHLMSSS